MRVAVIDYGMSNLGSVRRALEECGADVSLCREPQELDGEERIVLPGVGAFADGSRNLTERGWMEALPPLLAGGECAILGICLGMQLLADYGEEAGGAAGLGLIPGRVVRLSGEPGERIPHVGWNEVAVSRPVSLLNGLRSGTDFYFVHSYHFSGAGAAVVARTPYAGGFTSVVAARNVFGTQFHPEKSSRPGFMILRNFLSPDLSDA